ncbi:MAG: hypothetical protein GF308_11415 [Candidatus Heimdallarchaeota archaeon]|nr:hypothetical protein [Candidatus Heimdallarchaeota archaeon]
MIDLKEFNSFIEKNFHYVCGVPCSYYKDYLDFLTLHKNETKVKHIAATREDEAVGIASGVVFSGKQALVYMQNSGLGNIGDALTSLAQLYKLPMLLLISYRGLEPDRDFPEHSLMGDVTEPVLQSLQLTYGVLSENNWKIEMERAIKAMEQESSPVALLVKKGVLSQ